MPGNVKELRRRIRSVQSTQQITRAMKLVAASKLRRAQENMERARPYAAGIRQLLANVASRVGEDGHPLLAQRDGNRTLLVAVTADRGLAGSFNSTVLRAAQNYLDETDRDVTLELVGRKARDYFQRRPNPVRATHVDIYRTLDQWTSRALAETFSQAFLEEGFDEVVILSNRFKTVMTQDTVFDRLIPAGVPEAEESSEDTATDYIYEPAPRQLLDAIVPQAIETLVHQALLESYAAEMGARMVAMDNATNNAEDMIAHLTLVMNRTRQAAITTEIIEIVSGAQALEGA